MPSFSPRSLKARKELALPLQKVVDAAIKEFDFTLLDAQRGRAEQERAFRAGYSKAHFGESAHNYKPAIAFDAAPYPIDFDDIPRFRVMAKTFLRIAKTLNVPLRWGGDWDMDGDWRDERFLDWGHFELSPLSVWMKKSKLIGD